MFRLFASIFVIGWTFVSRLPLLARTIFVAIGAGVAGSIAVTALANLDRIMESLGASLSVRQRSMALVTNYLLNEPLRWIFGVGGTTRFGNTTLSQIMGSASFYLADGQVTANPSLKTFRGQALACSELPITFHIQRAIRSTQRRYGRFLLQFTCEPCVGGDEVIFLRGLLKNPLAH